MHACNVCDPCSSSSLTHSLSHFHTPHKSRSVSLSHSLRSQNLTLPRIYCLTNRVSSIHLLKKLRAIESEGMLYEFVVVLCVTIKTTFEKGDM